MRWRVANQTRSKLRLLCGFAVFSLSPSLLLLQCSHSVRHSTRRAGRTKHVYTSDRTGTRTNNGQHKESSCRSVQCLWQTQASWARRKKERNGKEVGGGGGVGGISAQQSTDTTLDQSTGGLDGPAFERLIGGSLVYRLQRKEGARICLIFQLLPSPSQSPATSTPPLFRECVN